MAVRRRAHQGSVHAGMWPQWPPAAPGAGSWAGGSSSAHFLGLTGAWVRGRSTQKLPRARPVFFTMPIRKQASFARHGSESLSECLHAHHREGDSSAEGRGGMWRGCGRGRWGAAQPLRPLRADPGGSQGWTPLALPSHHLHQGRCFHPPFQDDSARAGVCVYACAGGRVCGCTCFSFINMSQKSSHRCEEGGWPSATRYSKTPLRVEGAFRSSSSH